MFATNRLVLAIPTGNPAGVASLADLGPRGDPRGRGRGELARGVHANGARGSRRSRCTIAAVTTSERTDEANAFVELVLGDEGGQALVAAGFGLP